VKEGLMLRLRNESFSVFNAHLWKITDIVNENYPDFNNDQVIDMVATIAAHIVIRHHNVLSDIVQGKNNPPKVSDKVDVDGFLKELGFKVRGENGSNA